MKNKISSFYLLSIICALIPLLTGTIIFLLWVITRKSFLESFGVYTIYGGFFLFILGIIFLAVYFFMNRKNDTIKFFKTKILISLLILLSNFPIAGYYFINVCNIISISEVYLENKTICLISEITISDPIKTYNIQDISPGRILKQKFIFEGEGVVKYSFIVNKKVQSGVLIGYISPGMGINVELIIHNEDKIEVKQKHI